MKQETLFLEKQKFTQWWLWAILLVPLGILLYKIVSPIRAQHSNDAVNQSTSIIIPMEDWIVLLISVAVLLFFGLMRMTTEIDAKKIVVKHLFFVRRKWDWEDIESAEIISYGFVGYGIRISLNHGTVYNVKGNKGLFLKWKNGKRRLIGTQKPDELRQLITQLGR